MGSFLQNMIAKLRGAPQQPDLPQNVSQAAQLLSKEEPDFDPSSVRKAGMIRRMLHPGAQAEAGLMGGIYVNPANTEGLDPQDMADTLLHEQTHVRQGKGRGLMKELYQRMMQNQGWYGQRPDELEAFQAERDRRAKMGRPGAIGTPFFEQVDPDPTSYRNFRQRGDIPLR